MSIFTSNECDLCIGLQSKIDALQQRNELLEKALRQLKKKYNEQYSSESIVLTPDEVTLLFKKIKSSPYSSDIKRYLRSTLMLIKATNDSSLYAFLATQLKRD